MVSKPLNFYTPGSTNIAGWKMDPLKMYFLLEMVIFHCYVSLPEGNLNVGKGWSHERQAVKPHKFHPKMTGWCLVMSIHEQPRWLCSLPNDLQMRNWFEGWMTFLLIHFGGTKHAWVILMFFLHPWIHMKYRLEHQDRQHEHWRSRDLKTSS